MCGFAGFLGSSGPASANAAIVERMADAIRHRGPDDSGTFTDEASGLALGHRRLSIIDLSPAGHQPMVSQSGRFVIAFNGEIYNFADVRTELESVALAPQWRGHSDTEVLLAAIEAWGTAAALTRCAGMFAFAVFDRQTRTLTLARDRLGEKPLYYGHQGGVFLFGSDLAALKQHPSWQGEIDRDALTLLLRYNSIPAPHSIYRGIAKLEPGCILEMKAGGEPSVTRYWDATREIANAAANPFAGSASDAAVETERLLRQSLSGQMISDVPLGAFLSGGIDSSTVVALMQAMSTRPVKTFSIGFREQGYDEAPFAKAVAQHLGTDHTELYVTESDALATVPRLASVYSEPFADSSQIPTLLVSELARRHVTVALSGDGGDELFCGYTRYTLGQKTWNRLRHIPAPLRRTIARAVTAAGPEALNRLLRPATNLLPQRYRIERPGDRLVKGASVAALNSLDDVYRVLISHWQTPGDIVIGGREPELRCAGGLPPDLDPVRRMMHDDLVRYLPDDILAKVDRAAMSVSLETRVPLLDHRLVEFSASLPMRILCHEGKSKWPLREILFHHVPRHLIDRPKMGFGIPLDAWLRGPLRNWAEDLLDETRLKSDGFFRPAPIRKAWIDHLSGARNMHYPLWVILMFQSWLTQERQGSA